MTTRSTKNEHTGEIRGWWEDPDDPVHVLYACASGDFGMVQLWNDPEVRATLTKRRVRMEESSGLYVLCFDLSLFGYPLRFLAI